MGRFSELSEEETDNGIDISPLIDVVFILLIFFIVTTVFVEESGLDVDKPQAAAASRLEKNSILIDLTENGEIVYGKQKIGLNGVRPLVKRLITAEEEMPVIIRADRNSQSGTLVRIIGEAKAAGAQKVSVAALAAQG